MTSRAGRVLALDLGQARIGLALSDPLGWTAQPLDVLERVGPRKDVLRITEIVKQRNVGVVVVGLPLLLSGVEGSAAAGAREFARRVEQKLPGVTVDLWDERLTTREADRTMIADGVRRRSRRRVVDALAAALILQSYLDSRPGNDETDTDEQEP